MPAPASSRHTRTLSPPLSTSSQALTAGTQQRMNVVTRLAVEGKAKQGEKGAGIRMYLKMSLPMDSVIAGSTIALFPEENVKILTSQVHPIDSNSVPYNFSSTVSPLLHTAARALNLPARSPKLYQSLFGQPAGSSSRHSSSINGSNVQTLDDKYTGHILVSGYNVSYVLPKEFPPRFNDDHSSPTNSLKRRPSERGHMHFMAAVELWVPYISKPPRAPYLLSIPVPRCLSNNIRLRIFPPSVTAQSFASLSSIEDEGGSWDLTSDPHVTRNPSSRASRTGSYNQFADDESSDSSTAGFSEGCGIQGSFPSTDRIRVRWATPSKSVDFENDGRRRVGVREVKSEMNCIILGKGKDQAGGEVEGVVMRVEYKGTCKGIWFGGVATLLGMDVGLEAKGSDVSWVDGLERKWEVGGGTGYTGFDNGAPPSSVRQPSRGSPETFLSPLSTDGKPPSAMVSRQNSTSSTASLLRAPLPATNVAEYSFEGSTASLTESATTMSSISSLPQATLDANSRPPSPNSATPEASNGARSPAIPLTIHINMNDLLPPSKNVLTFSITGTVLVMPRRRSFASDSSSPISGTEADPEPIVLPKFTIFTADSETTSTMIRSEVDSATVEVYNAVGDIRDAQTRRTVLQKGGLARCGVEGGRIALRSIASAFARIKGEHAQSNGTPGTPTPSRSRLPNSLSRVPSSSSLKHAHAHSTAILRPKRDGPLMIPSVDVTVTPLSGNTATPDMYAVRVCLPAPTDASNEWLEFGLARPSASSSTDGDDPKPIVDIVSASIEGVPVRFETSTFVKQEQSRIEGVGMPFGEAPGAEWVSWIRVHVGEAGGGRVQVDYVVKTQDADVFETEKRKGKRKAGRGAAIHVLLPTFQLAVGRLVVNVETDQDFRLSSLKSNFSHQQSAVNGPRLLHYSLDELFCPRLSMIIQPGAPWRASFTPIITQVLIWTIPTVLSLFLLLRTTNLGSELHEMQRSLDSCSTIINSGWELDATPETTTITSTVLPSGHAKWWFGDEAMSEDFITTSEELVPTPTFTEPFLPTPTPAITMPPELPVLSLMPVTNISFRWPINFDLPEEVQETLNSVLRRLGLFWEVCKKVYHYPLDPS